MDWKKIHDTGLRGAFCTIWVAAGIIAAMDVLVAALSDYDSPEQTFYTRQGIACGLVFFIAALAHSYLLSKVKKDDKNEDDEPFY